MTFHTYREGEFLISTDPALLDVAAMHAYLTRAYWSEGIAQETVARAAAHSLCFGVYHVGEQHTQIGLARIVSDMTTFAYICDVYILEKWRGKGLSKKLMATIKSHPDLQGLRTWFLATRDAHGLYRQFGFEALSAPQRYMIIRDPNIYKRGASGTGRGG